jgi:tRNA(Ile)-lysidine synthase
LPIARARLRATLLADQQPWIDDPSNDDPAHARIRMRKLLPALAAEGLDAARLAATAAHLGRARATIDDAVADLLAEAAAIFPAGYLRLDPVVLRAAPIEVSLRALAHCLMVVGGGEYAPRLDRLERLHGKVQADTLGGGATLAGCLVIPRRGALLICREPAMATEELVIAPDATTLWDGRFRITLESDGSGRRTARLVVRRLGVEGWAAIAARDPGLRRHPIPPAVRPGLPALWGARGVLAVPHLDAAPSDRHMTISAVFCPPEPFVRTRFTVA